MCRRILVNGYEALQAGHIRGVIPGIQDIPPNDLKQHLRCSGRKNHHCSSAIGKTNSALVTFNAPIAPAHCSPLQRRYKSLPLQATHSCICDTCDLMGHKKDIFPNHTAPKYFTCGLAAVENHQCAITPSCTNCEGAHLATDPTSPARKQAQDATFKRLKHHGQIGHEMPPCMPKR
ncbi:hypothetical protein HPB48_015320 [Haemaphysalis longicornis]|uniref:Uncharacterized protein n=1 Tax=Haemaphysalis longicornis TaxID=44386 RepID=A0A9J6GBN8_HAELO|nr:hypothetical protein HPB48_015320 [Haemaphysalis longicornis]